VEGPLGPLIQKSITSEAPTDMKFYYQWRSNIAVGASLVIDFCISGPSTGNSNYKNLLPVRRPLIIKDELAT